MITRNATIASSAGLHARPAMLFTEAVADSGVPVTLAYGDAEPVDAASILLVMSLAIPAGAEVVLTADGEEAARTLDELVAFLETDLDAEPAGDKAAS